MPQRFNWVARSLRNHRGVLGGSERSNHRKDCEHETKIADAIGNEGLTRSIGGFVAIEVVTN